jgi:flagellar basal-body rod protein FlgB
VGPTVDTGVEFLRQVLDLRGYRQQILSADIANASTPKFKGVDLDFRQALAAATDGGDQEGQSDGVARGVAAPQPAGLLWLVDDARQLPGPSGAAAVDGAAAAAIKYQADAPVTLDGNSVDLNQVKIAAAENAVQYEAAATFASQMIKMLTTAVGEAATSASGGGE